MAKCDICSKDIAFGLNVSHSNRKSNRAWKPNVKKVKVLEDGTPKSLNVCTRCLRSNKVTRAV
jgi:large subunit ribosomal protein L28